jgi:hypothetical protein
MTNSIPRNEHDVRENERFNVIQGPVYWLNNEERYKPSKVSVGAGSLQSPYD